MPQFEKLLTDVGPADPPARVAQRALASRLRAVVFYLDRAAASSLHDVEEIHQLRVWTRRSQAALKLFSPLLPPRKSARLKKGLRRLRRTAGSVRDLDVVETQFGQALDGPLARRLEVQHKAARKSLRQLVLRWSKSGKLKRKIKRLTKRLGRRADFENNGIAFAPWCRRQLLPLVEDFSGRASGGARQTDAALHQWRLATKRLRYAVELAPAALPKESWTRLYKLLGDIQERMGRVCDALLQRRRLRQWRRETDDPAEREALERLSAQCERRLAAARRAFARWWTSHRSKSVQDLCRQAATVT